MDEGFKTKIQLRKEIAELQEKIARLKASESKLEFTERMFERKNHQQEQLLETARYLTESLDIKDVLTRIATKAREILKAAGCAIYFLDEDGKTLTPKVAIEPEFEEEILASPIDIDNSFTGQAVKAGKAMLFNDTVGDETGYLIPGTPVIENERIIAAPFIIDGEVIGAMCIDRRGISYFKWDLALAETFATFASAAIKSARINEALQDRTEECERLQKAFQELEEKYNKLLQSG